MSFARSKPIPFILFAISWLPLGCSENKAGGDPEMQRRKSHLAQIYEFYMTYSKANQRPPKQLSDFKQYEGIDAVALRALETGEYVAIWGVNLSKDPDAILAYEKDAAKQGGYVVLGDGTVKKMTSQEFQSASKR